MSPRAVLERVLDALDNPILVKELRGAFRRWRFLILHTALLLGVAAVLLFAMSSSAAEDADPSKIGRATFLLILGLETVLAMLLFPAVTCTSIIEERTTSSFDLLVTTRLGAPHIVLGKLLAAAVYGSLLIISTAPLVTVTFLYGGVSPGQIALSLAAVLLCGFVFATYGLLVSSLSFGVARAVVRTFLGLPAMAALVFMPLGWLVLTVVIQPLTGKDPDPWLRGLDLVDTLTVWAAAFLWPFAWGSLFFVLATNQLQPERANRHTPLRVWFLTSWTVALVLFLVARLRHEPLPSSDATWVLIQCLGATVVGLTLAAVAFVTEDDRPQRGRDTRSRGPLTLLLPGAARGAAFVLAIAAVTLAILWVVNEPAARAGGRRDLLRTLAEVRSWGVAWTAGFLLTVTQVTLLAGRVARNAAQARIWTVVLLCVTTFYPAVWYWLQPAGSAAKLHQAYPLSMIPVGVSVASVDRDLERHLILFGPSADDMKLEADRFVADLQRADERAHPGADAKQRDRLAKARAERRRAFISSLAAQGVRVRTASTLLYGVLGLGLLALNVALFRRDRRRSVAA